MQVNISKAFSDKAMILDLLNALGFGWANISPSLRVSSLGELLC